MHGEKEGGNRGKTTLSEKEEEASTVMIYNPLSNDSNMAGQQMLTNYPTQRMRGLDKHRDRLPPSFVHHK